MKIEEYFYTSTVKRLKLKFVAENEAEACLLDQMSSHDSESGAAGTAAGKKYIWHNVRVGE